MRSAIDLGGGGVEPEERAARLCALLRAAIDEPQADGHAVALHAAMDAEFAALIAKHVNAKLDGEPDARAGVASAVWVRLFDDDAAIARAIVDAPDPIGRLIAEITGAAWTERRARVDVKRERHDKRIAKRGGRIPPPRKDRADRAEA